jgi:hypothetical protein
MRICMESAGFLKGSGGSYRNLREMQFNVGFGPRHTGRRCEGGRGR